MRRLFEALFGLLLIAAGVSPALAEQSEFGDYVVHYNAFTSDFLQPSMARAYGITRSKNRGLLNVTVRKRSPDNTEIPAKARVTAQAINLNSQIKSIPMRPVEDQGTTYYIGDFRVTNRENLTFNIEVTPEDQKDPLTITFKQEFFTD